jgi:hypothetical protein
METTLIALSVALAAAAVTQIFTALYTKRSPTTAAQTANPNEPLASQPTASQAQSALPGMPSRSAVVGDCLSGLETVSSGTVGGGGVSLDLSEFSGSELLLTVSAPCHVAFGDNDDRATDDDFLLPGGSIIRFAPNSPGRTHVCAVAPLGTKPKIFAALPVSAGPE